MRIECSSKQFHSVACERWFHQFAFLFLRVTKEVDDVIGMKQEISYDDLGQLVYLSQVHVMKHVVNILTFIY